MLEAITVGGPNATLPDLYQLNLWVKAPATAEVIAAKNELHDLADQGSPTEDAWDRLSLEVEIRRHRALLGYFGYHCDLRGRKHPDALLSNCSRRQLRGDLASQRRSVDGIV